MLGDGGIALAVVVVPHLVEELGPHNELGELARVLGTVDDEGEALGTHDELGELDLVLGAVDDEEEALGPHEVGSVFGHHDDEHYLEPCGEEDGETHVQCTAPFLHDAEEARHGDHVVDVDVHVDDDALVGLQVLHVDGDLVRPIRRLHLLLKECVGDDGLGVHLRLFLFNH